MNVELLEKVKAAILAEPEHFRMDTWSCGTAHCIAGWALMLHGLKIANPNDHAVHQLLEDGRMPMPVAAELLGLQTEELGDDDEADRLFMSEEWPEELYERYETTDDLREKAVIAAERIDRFIATDGRQ